MRDRPYSYRNHTFETYREANEVAQDLNKFEREESAPLNPLYEFKAHPHGEGFRIEREESPHEYHRKVAARKLESVRRCAFTVTGPGGERRSGPLQDLADWAIEGRYIVKIVDIAEGV